MDCGHCPKQTDHGPDPYIINIEQAARKNQNFRTTVWTGCHLQMTLMCIPPCGEIGLEMHPDTDQYIRVGCGRALVKMGECRERLDLCCKMCRGDAVFVPAGTWHNVINTGREPLKVSSIYAPPEHPKGTVHRTREDAQKEEH